MDWFQKDGRVTQENKKMASPYQVKAGPASSHSLLARWLQTFQPGTVVMDIGTASGTLAKLCQGHGLIFRGVEVVETWADEAQPYYQEICQRPLNETPDEFLMGSQVVVLADVLEHMPDPDQQLARLVSLQLPGTQFLISVPNVANIWVRLHLLTGHFDYADRGILDRTHMRFFTRKTIVELVEKAGLRIEQIAASPIPLELVHPFFTEHFLGRWISHLLALLTRCFTTLLGYQFVIKAEKPE